MNGEITIESSFRLKNGLRGQRQLVPVPQPAAVESMLPAGRVPRVARLMALAIHLDWLLREGALKDFAEIARLGHITRARATQVMNLLMLAPDLQERILFLPLVEQGRDPVKEWQLRSVAATADWAKQRKMWAEIVRSSAAV